MDEVKLSAMTRWIDCRKSSIGILKLKESGYRCFALVRWILNNRALLDRNPRAKKVCQLQNHDFYESKLSIRHTKQNGPGSKLMED